MKKKLAQDEVGTGTDTPAKKIKFKYDDDDDTVNDDAKAASIPDSQPSAEVTDAAKAKKKRKTKGLMRKMKKKEEREKQSAAEREARVANGGPEKLPTPKQLASKYLREWIRRDPEHDATSAWKFQKSRQLWIMRNILNINNISDADFEICVKYCKSMNENARMTVREKARSAVANPEAETASPEQVRARRLVEALS
ncbi:hypothetical protein HDU84_007764 [Entophlyctis sp. JEL0112]|nr:hypothetical protein HDU84_007764 [Entophlyctis sp. JEL0112]